MLHAMKGRAQKRFECENVNALRLHFTLHFKGVRKDLTVIPNMNIQFFFKVPFIYRKFYVQNEYQNGKQKLEHFKTNIF